MRTLIPTTEFGINRSDIQVYAQHGNEFQFDPYVPQKKGYVFTPAYLISLAGLMDACWGDIIVDFGASGKGKTDGIRQFAARTFWPLFQVEGTKDTSFQLDLMGRLDPSNGSFMAGGAYQAMKKGGILLINEADVMQASELVSFYEIFNGIEVAATGEFVLPHPAFRVVFTFNNGGLSGLSGMRGTSSFSEALIDRFIPVVPNDLNDEQIQDMVTIKLNEMLPSMKAADHRLSESVINKVKGNIPSMVKIYRMIEDAVNNSISSGDLTMTNGVALNVPMSNRSLTRWSREMVRTRQDGNRLIQTFDQAFGYRFKATPAVYIALHKLCQAVFGNEVWPDPVI